MGLLTVEHDSIIAGYLHQVEKVVIIVLLRMAMYTELSNMHRMLSHVFTI